MTTEERQRYRGQLDSLQNKEFAAICLSYQRTFGWTAGIVGRDEWMRHMLKDHKLEPGTSRAMRDKRLRQFFSREGLV